VVVDAFVIAIAAEQAVHRPRVNTCAPAGGCVLLPAGDGAAAVSVWRVLQQQVLHDVLAWTAKRLIH
jgi:hypothetical protein